MSLLKRGNTYWIDVTIRGERIRQSLKTSERREADRRAKELERALWEGTFIERNSFADGVSLKQAFEELYAIHWSEKKDKEGVCARFDTLTKFIPSDTPVKTITRDRIDALVLQMKKATYTRSPTEGAKQYPYKRASINRVLALLGFILNRMADKGVIEAAPRMPKAEEQQRTRYLEEAEEEAMWDALEHCPNPRWRECMYLFQFLTDTGCRLGEALKLRWRDLRGDYVVLPDTKSGEDVLKPLTTRAKAVLAIMEQADFRQAGPFAHIKETVWRNAWDYAKKEAGLSDDHTLVRHSLRHTMASRLVQRGVDSSMVQDLLGHKSGITTKRYTHLGINHKKAAIAVLEKEKPCVQTVQQPSGLTYSGLLGIMPSFNGFTNSSIAQSVERRTVNPVITFGSSVDLSIGTNTLNKTRKDDPAGK